MRKILYSPGFGAGWSTFMEIPAKFACEYQPIIDALERGEVMLSDEDDCYGVEITDYHPAVQQFVKDCKEKFGSAYVCILGAKNLEIREVNDDDLVEITHYDGSESVKIKGQGNYF